MHFQIIRLTGRSMDYIRRQMTNVKMNPTVLAYGEMLPASMNVRTQRQPPTMNVFPPLPHSITSPRPLVRRRHSPKQNGNEDDLLEKLKAQIIQDRLSREEERKQREEERQLQRGQQEAEAKRHGRFLEMMMMMMCRSMSSSRGSGGSSGNDMSNDHQL